MKISNDEMDKMTDEVRQSIADDIEKNIHLSYLFSFRDLSDSELESYVKLNESAVNRETNQLLTSAIIAAINQAANRAAQVMTHQAAR